MITQPRLGFIGLGVMGRLLALHLIAAGAAVKQRMNALMSVGDGGADFSVLIRALERAVGDSAS